MVEVAPAPAATPAKAVKKRAVKPKKAGPTVSELIAKAVAACQERSGMSTAALKKALAAGGYDVEGNKARVRTTIRNMVTKETLIQVKGTGASGSFKLNKAETKAAKPAKKAAPKAKKLAAKKPKAAAKKSATPKKSPKKAKKPAAAAKKAAKSPKKPAKSPKKPAKSPKKPAKKAPMAKKTPVKKTVKPKAKKAAAKKK
ncbi:histone H1-like [Brachyistius frenatus]|uniref:histone H1-like n=1 Tax=Brachyistius frenatus TaxID=100188 RepID=UPI0037E6FC85